MADAGYVPGGPGPDKKGPGQKKPPRQRLNKNLRDRIDVITAAANIHNPGLTPEQARNLVQSALKQGLPAHGIIRFMQSPLFSTLGDDPQAAIDLFASAPGSLQSALRLSRELGRMQFNRPEDDETPFVGRKGTFKALLAGLHPEFKGLFTGGATEDEDGNILDEEGVIDETLNPIFGPPPPEPVVMGDEDQLGLSGAVQEMMAARQRTQGAQSYYGDTFSYDELLGGGEE